MSPRPARALIIVTVFLVGAYPPVIWAALWILAWAPPAVVVPIAALLGMTGSLIGLWRPTPGGWVGAMVIFGFGGGVSATPLALSFPSGWKGRAVFDAAGLAQFMLALVTLLAAPLVDPLGGGSGRRQLILWIHRLIFRRGDPAAPATIAD